MAAARPGSAGADDHDVVIAGVGDVGDGLGLHEECRSSVPGCCCGLLGGGYRLLGCAAPSMDTPMAPAAATPPNLNRSLRK